ncbi:MAG TPA: phage tail sheath family protein [Candidatus Fimicola cottocaccae]|nr:phage tail sheath family protein [Candidatus Fimicola cottocaccae]
MALGGGTFFTQNKVLPGAYINFISASKASATLSDRGYAAMALELDWGVENTIFEVTNGDLQKNSMKLFGYDYTAPQLKGLRDLFLNLKTLYIYRLTSGGVKATNTYATAKYCGTRGNNLKVVISNNIEEEEKFDVSLYIDDTTLLDKQTVSQMSELVDNDYVTWKSGASLSETAGEPLSTGTNGTVNGAAHQTFLDKAESYYFNILGCVSTEDEIKSLYVAYTKRLRDEVGAKFQLVVHNKEADYEGVINVINDVEESPVSSLVYWITGAEASCAVNASLLNKKYDGEFTVKADYTQSQLEGFINAGKFAFHNVGNDARVLSDINTLLTVSDTKGDVFKENQTIRVCDQIANDIANIFNTRYLGVVPNDANGRISLWNDIVKHHQQLQDIRAIENFTSEDITVAQGDSKKAVVVYDKVTVVNAMAQLYMTVEIA